MMKKTITIDGKEILVSVTNAAEKKLQQLTQPITIEMELYFSCLLRKRVNFRFENSDARAVALSDKCLILFRTMTGDRCSVELGPKAVEFEIKNRAAFVPKWLEVDFKHGSWVGEFGFDVSE